jgi:hypothetical protein
MLQVPLEKVLEDVSPKITDVGIIVNGRPARVEPHVARVSRSEFLNLSGKSIKKTDRHECGY